MLSLGHTLWALAPDQGRETMDNGYKSDIEIARAADKKPIQDIGAKLGIGRDDLLPYGHDKAKVSQTFINSVQSNTNGKLILVTAINPTPAGEGGRVCADRANGRYEPSFHGRLSCDYIGAQPAVGDD